MIARQEEETEKSRPSAAPVTAGLDGGLGVGIIRWDDRPKQLDEAVWQAWVNKNKAQDEFRFMRRLRVTGFVLVILTAGALLWALTS